MEREDSSQAEDYPIELENVATLLEIAAKRIQDDPSAMSFRVVKMAHTLEIRRDSRFNWNFRSRCSNPII